MATSKAPQDQLALSFGAPWNEGPLLGFDLETTGADPRTALPVSFALVEFDAGKHVTTRHELVDPGVAIPAETTDIHGITNAMVKADGMPLEAALNVLVDRLLRASAAGVPVVGMNVSYDLTLLDAALRRRHAAGGGDGSLQPARGLAEHGWAGPVLDILVLDRHLDRWRKGKRRLAELCATYGVELEHAHDAAADTIGSVEVLLAITAQHPGILLEDPGALTGLQATWHREWFDSFNAYRRRNGDSPIPDEEASWPVAGC